MKAISVRSSIKPQEATPLRVAGLFAGIGGVERGLAQAGHVTELLCEIDPAAQRVLAKRFPDILIAGDVRTLRELPTVDLVTGGFPCQDLSQAGRTAGIRGERSGLVSEVFRLIEQRPPRWLLLENVPFMLQLDRGKAMLYLTRALSDRGFNWAYRVVDTRAFGLPQRRQRVLLLASQTEDPRRVLFADDAGDPPLRKPNGEVAYGFYWTEGIRGLGWAIDAVPTLKGGSTVGIPSPPAVLMPSGDIVTPHITDAERLQGFPANWTAPAVDDPSRKNGPRWRLVGNAVSVPVFKWVGRRLRRLGEYVGEEDQEYDGRRRWPNAAWSIGGGPIHQAPVSVFPKRYKRTPLAEFLSANVSPLSTRATAGFLHRTDRSTLNFPDGFLAAVRRYLAKQLESDARAELAG